MVHDAEGSERNVSGTIRRLEYGIVVVAFRPINRVIMNKEKKSSIHIGLTEGTVISGFDEV